MAGVLASALEARDIASHPDRLSCDVEGLIEKVDGKSLLTAIRVHYHVRVPKDKSAEAIRALETHEKQCPASQSVRRGIQIEYDWRLEEE